MKSPFPGMDPYLERHWPDVHTKLVTYVADSLNESLPDDLIARAQERAAIETEGPVPDARRAQRHVVPDARVFQAVTEYAEGGAAGGGVALAPFRLSLLDEPAIERYVEIIDVRGGERLVSVIEVLSPDNKRGAGLDAFTRKRSELLDGSVNFVEIDLIRAGNWRELLRPYACPPEAQSTYRAVLYVPSDRAGAYLQPMHLRETLPALQIPLRPGETPCVLAVQPLVDSAYSKGRYARTLDYDRPCDPPLEGSDAQWADELLRAAGRR